jgi:large subunit ribosomal protein L24
MPHIKKEDTVKVITGSDKGKTGKVTKVFPAHLDKRGNKVDARVIVEGVNVRKRHEKPNRVNQNGGIVDKEMPIAMSNVMLMDGGVPVRTRLKINPDAKKQKRIRVSVKTGNVI